jgi:hypothetical protein
MTFKPAVWRPIAVVLSGLNVVAVGFAAAAAGADRSAGARGEQLASGVGRGA